MKPGRLGFLLFFQLAVVAHADAEPPVPDDFAYGMAVETEGQASLWQVWLPEDVYQKVTRADFGDMRVFDASGQVVPHLLRSPEATVKEPPSPVSLPIFPLYHSDTKASAGQSLRILTDDKGAVVDVVRESVATGDKEVIYAYIIDATTIEHKPDRIILDWESDRKAGFSTDVSVDVSDDLSAWQRLVSSATLAELQFDAHQLSEREIDLPVRSYRYLRINWPEMLREVRLKSITAAFPSVEQPPQRHWLKVKGTKNTEIPGSYDFDTNGNWPVDQVRFVFPKQNMLINVELASRPDETFVWTRRHLGPFYTLLKDDGAMLTSPPAMFGMTTDRYWHIEEVGGGNVLERFTPVLELGWIPHVLTFVAQGEPPYVIAYGSGTIEPIEQALDPVTLTERDPEQKVLIKTATISPSRILGGVVKLEPPPPPLPWQKWLLWAVLIVGVVLLALMVWRLSRQMGESENTP